MKIKTEINKILQAGTVIPAHPLALNSQRKLDEKRQAALTRYYMASGAGGIAVGVHTTQFEIRSPEFNLYRPVLKIASDTVNSSGHPGPFIKVAGIVGPTEQAVREAETAAELGYDFGLVSMGGLGDWTEKDLIGRVEKISEIIPVFGFYLQPAVGGRLLSFSFWKDFADIPDVYAIKIAPFNRYQTLDVVRAVCHSGRHDQIALYTGNDDNIVADLLTDFAIPVNGKIIRKPIVGGLLGHWAVWTQKAVSLLEEIKRIRQKGDTIPADILSKGVAVTDSNAAVFDTANNFKGCIAGIHEILRRQGLLEGTWCLNPEEALSPGQAEEISRVYSDYPDLNDDEFVAANLDKWIKG